MKFLHCVCIFLTLARIVLPAPLVSRASEVADWSYVGSTGPEFWHTINPNYASCGNTSALQSPINIDDEYTVKVKGANMGTIIDIQGAEYKATSEPNNFSFECERHGHCSNVSLGCKVLTLQQFHIHLPSENTLNGEQKDLEIHMVHSDEEGNIAVVGVLFDVDEDDDDDEGDEKNKVRWKGGQKDSDDDDEDTEDEEGEIIDFSSLIKSIPQESSFEFDLRNIINPYSAFYSFSGSLTTPPCSDGLNWIVQKTLKKVSRRHVNELLKLLGPAPRGNWRPIQPLNGRRIERYE